MSENTPYFDSITSARSLLLSTEDQLAGLTLISAETESELTEHDLLTYICENLPGFLHYVRYLGTEDQELLFSYYLLSKTQSTLALIHRSTQTVCSFRLRMAVKTLCAFIMMGDITADKIKAILRRHNLEVLLDERLPLSTCIYIYSHVRSFDDIAFVYRVHRPHIRKAMSRVSKDLLVIEAADARALGAYVHSLIDKANPIGRGYTKRKRRKLGDISLSDPEILGDFRIRVSDADFEHMFVSRANR